IIMNRIVKIDPEMPAYPVARWIGSVGRHAFLATALAAVFFLSGGAPVQAQSDITNVITDSVTRNVTGNIGSNLEAKLVKPTLSVKQSAGAVRGQAISTGDRYLSLLLADGTVPIWDLGRGV